MNQVLEVNQGVNLHDRFGNGFLDMTLKTQAIKGKIHKLYIIKTKIFILQKLHQESEKTSTEWEKLFKSYI